VNWYNNRLLLLIRQFFRIPNKVYGSQTLIFYLLLESEYDYYRGFTHSQLRTSDLRTRFSIICSAVCICLCLTSLIYLRSITERSPSTCLKYCGNLQADHSSHLPVCYFYAGSPTSIHLVLYTGIDIIVLVSQALLISTSASEFSKPTNLFEIPTRNCSLLSTSFNSLILNLPYENVQSLLKFWKSIPNVRHH
jgi:hypothetical protein